MAEIGLSLPKGDAMMKRSNAVRPSQERGLRRLLFLMELIFVAVTLILAPMADALQLQIKEDVDFSVRRSSHVVEAGTLAANSIIDVPDQYRVTHNHRVDVQATLKNWLRKTRRNHHGVSANSRNALFPIHIIRAAAGSELPHSYRGREFYLPLREVAQDGDLLKVRHQVKLYSHWRATTPLEVLASHSTVENQDGATADCHCSREDHPLSSNARTSLQETAHALSESRASRNEPSEEGDSGSLFSPVNDGHRLPAIENSCSSTFVDRDGNYGAFGRIVLKEITRPEYGIYFESDNQLSRICPNFDSFSKKKKEQYLVWVYASLASQESDCEEGRRAPPKLNPNGVAVGLFQMELNELPRHSRDLAYGGNYCEGDPFSPQVNIRCSVKIMANRLESKSGLYGGTTKTQYWHPLLNLPGSNRNKAKTSIARYRDCFSGENQ